MVNTFADMWGRLGRALIATSAAACRFRGAPKRAQACAFTLIELLVVMAIIATLLTIALPRYFKSVDRSREAVLREDLRTMRQSIDAFYADHDRYPDSLETLAARQYLRALPPDPITGSTATWIVVQPPSESEQGTVYDVRSGASGAALDGTAYKDW